MTQAASVLVVLDVDGTVSPINPPAHLAGQFTMHSYLPINERLVDELDEITRMPGVSVAWLTSWEEPSVHWLINELGGRLAGPYLAHTPNWFSRPAGWRARTLLEHLTRTRPAALIWADDMAGDGVNRRRLDRAGYRNRHLLFQPDPNVGLTLDDVRRMRAFIDRIRLDMQSGTR